MGAGVRRGADTDGVTSTLVVVPPHLQHQWFEEAQGLGADTMQAVQIEPFQELVTLARAHSSSRARYDRLVVDEPQHLSTVELDALRILSNYQTFDFIWVLCGTARSQLRRCAMVAWGGELPFWAFGANARTIQRWAVACPRLEMGRVGVWERLAMQFVATCCVADAPSDCLPVPPISPRLIPVALPMASAMFMQACFREGEIRRAVQICNGVDVGSTYGREGRSRSGSKPPLLSRDDWEHHVEEKWRVKLEHALPARDGVRARADMAHGAFLASIGLRCACADGAFWHCTGVPLEGDVPPDDVHQLVAMDETQGVSDELRDEFGKAQASVEHIEGLLRWAANAKQALSSPDATCGVCLGTLFDKTVAMWPCLHCICDECANGWRQASRTFDALATPCPHCKVPARRAQLAIFAPRGAASVGAEGHVAAAALEGVGGVQLPDDGKLNALIRLVSSVLDTAPDERLCVFAQWEGVLQAAANALQAAGIAYLSLAEGGLAGRIDALRRFGREGEPRVLLLASERHSSGLNLQSAKHVVLLHPYCPMDHSTAGGGVDALTSRSHAEALAFDTQAIGRVRRFPQEHIVCVHRFYVRGSVEEELLVAQGLQGL